MRVAKTRTPDGRLSIALIDDDEIEIPLVSKFLRALTARGCSPNTLIAYAHDLKHFYSFLNAQDLSPEQFTVRRSPEFLIYLDQERYQARVPGKRGTAVVTLSAATRNRILAAVSTFYEYLILTGATDNLQNPFDPGGNKRRPSLPQRPIRRSARLPRIRRLPRPLSENQVSAILSVTNSLRDRAIFLLMLQGGLRPGEVLNLHLADIQYGRRRILIRYREDHPRGVRTKTRAERAVDLLEPESLATLSAYVVGERPRNADSQYVFLVGGTGQQAVQPLSYAGLVKSFKRRCQKAGLTDPWITPHSLRHTHATRLWQGGVRELTLQKRLGHASFEATQCYTRVTDHDLVADYQKALSRLSKEP
jgi:integrase/recombinase XerD